MRVCVRACVCVCCCCCCCCFQDINLKFSNCKYLISSMHLCVRCCFQDIDLKFQVGYTEFKVIKLKL